MSTPRKKKSEKQHKADVFIRLFFILVLAVFNQSKPILVLIFLLQLLAIVFDTMPIFSLVTISQYILGYFFDILEYLTGITPIPPFPFSPWRNRYDP